MTGSRRDRRAAATRREIVEAARHLFAERGYMKTTVAAIAERAEVSVQTIYDSLGSKGAIVRALNDLIDETGEVGPIVARMAEETDPRRLVELALSISRNICERCSDIVKVTFTAVAVEPELIDVGAEGVRRHRRGMQGLAERLGALGALREGVTEEHAAQVLAALSEPPVVFVFVDGHGWTYDEWHQWTVDLACERLLAPT